MEKVKHTPGPWRIDDTVHDIEILADPGFPCRYFGEAGVWPIAKAMNLHHADDSAGGVMEANARLIAAAPDLLQALTDLVGLIAQVAPGYVESPMVAGADSAIAKATGQ